MRRLYFLVFKEKVEVAKTLTPNPSPIKGEENKKILNLIFTPLLPSWEKGLGDEGRSSLCVR